jgi:transcriptional regulator with XRE-family HTH domain
MARVTGDARQGVDRTTDVAELARALRRRARLGQRELAGASGVAPSAVCAYEKGRRTPSLVVLQRLAHAAGFEVELGLVRLDAAGRYLVGPLGQTVLDAKERLLETLAEHGVTRVWVTGAVATGTEEHWDAVDLVVLGGPSTPAGRTSLLGYVSLALGVRTTLAPAEPWVGADGVLAVPRGAVELVATGVAPSA